MAQDDELDFDSLDGDMDDMGMGGADFDLDFDSSKPAPAGEIALSGVKSGASAFASSAGKEVLRQMPNADELVGEAGKVAGAVGELKDHFTKEMSETTKSVKSVLRKALPFTKKIVPSGVYDKLNEITKEQEELAKKSKEEERSDAINAELGDMFGKQARERMLERDEERANRLVDLTETNAKHKQLLAGSDALYKELVFANNFTITTQSAWMKKTLELKYRHLYVAQEALEVFKLFGKSVEEKLEKIRGNTGLTEVQKNRLNTSNIMGSIRAKGMEKISGSVGEYMSKVTDNIKKNGMSVITDKIGGMRGMLDQLAGAGDMVESMGEGGATEIGADLGGGAIGGFMGSQFVRKMAARMNSVLGKTDSIAKMAGSNAQFTAEKFKNAIASKFPQMAGMMDSILPGVTREKTIANSFLDEGASATEFDNITRQTIVEIIPSYLSLMVKHLKDISTGEDSEQLTYNPITRQLEGQSKVKQDVTDRAFQKEEERQAELAKGVGLMKGFASATGADKLTYDHVDKDLAKFVANHASMKIMMEPKVIKAYNETGEDPSPNGYIDQAFKDVKEPAALAAYIATTFYDSNGSQIIEAIAAIDYQIDTIRKNEQWKDVLPKMMEDFGLRGLYNGDMKDGQLTDEFFKDNMKYDADSQANKDIIESEADNAKGISERAARDDMVIRKALSDNKLASAIATKLNKGDGALSGYASLFDADQVEWNDEDLTDAERELIKLNGGKRDQHAINKLIDSVVSMVGTGKEKYSDLKEKHQANKEETSEDTTDERSTVDKFKDQVAEVRKTVTERVNYVKSTDEYKDIVKDIQDLPGELKDSFNSSLDSLTASADPEAMDELRSKVKSAKAKVIIKAGSISAGIIKEDVDDVMTKVKEESAKAKKASLAKVAELKKSDTYQKAIKNINDLPNELKDTYTKKLKVATESGNPEVLEMVNEKVISESIIDSSSDRLKAVIDSSANLPMPPKAVSTGASVGKSKEYYKDMLSAGVAMPPSSNPRVEEEPTVVKIDKTNIEAMAETIDVKSSDPDLEAPDTDNTFHGDFMGYWEYRKLQDALLLDAVLNGGSKKDGGLIRKLGGELGKGASALGGFYKDTYGTILKGASGAAKSGMDLAGKALPMMGRGAGNLLSAGKWMGGKYLDTVGSIYGGALSTAGKMFSGRGKKQKREDYVDVYRKDKREPGKPLARAHELEMYGTYAGGKKLKNVYGISEAVLHSETGKTLISQEDIEAVLVDVKGKLLSKGVGKSGGVLGGLLGGAKDLIKSGMGMYGDIYGTLLKGAGKGLGKVMGMFGGKGNSKIVDKLDLIYKLLDARLAIPATVTGDTDGDGDRDGSYKDQMSQAGRSGGSASLPIGSQGPNGGTINEDGDEVDSDGNLLSTAADLSMLMGGKGTRTGRFLRGRKAARLKRLNNLRRGAASGGKVARLAKYATKGGIAGRVAGGLAKVGSIGTALGGTALGAKVVAGGVAAKTAMVGGAVAAKGALVAGLAAVPVAGWIALAGVGVAAAGYGMFKAFSNTDAYKKLTAIRLDTYKLPSSMKTGDLEDFENDMYDLYTDGDEIDREDWAEEFGLDYGDDKQKAFFDNWFDKRALPTFKVYMAILKKLNIDFDDVDDMDADDEKYEPLVQTMKQVFPALNNRLRFNYEMSIEGYNKQVKKKTDQLKPKAKKSLGKKLLGMTPMGMLANTKLGKKAGELMSKGAEKLKDMGRSLWGMFKKTVVGGALDKGLKAFGVNIDTSKNPYLRSLNKGETPGGAGIQASLITLFQIPQSKLKVFLAYADDILERLKDGPVKANDEDNLDWMEEFGLDQDNPLHTKLFMYWYARVAKPVYWQIANLAKAYDMEVYEMFELDTEHEQYKEILAALRGLAKKLKGKLKFDKILSPEQAKPKPKPTKPTVPKADAPGSKPSNKTVGKTILDKNGKKIVVPAGQVSTPSDELIDSRNEAAQVVKHIETHKETFVNDNGEVVESIGKGNEALGGVNGGIGQMNTLLKRLVDNTGHLGEMKESLETNNTNNNVNVINAAKANPIPDEPAIANRKVMV